YLTSSLAVIPDLLSFPTRRSSDLSGLYTSRQANTSTNRNSFSRNAVISQAHYQWINLKGFEGCSSTVSNFNLEQPRNCALKLSRYRLSLSAQFRDRKSTRLNSSHVKISYAVFCWKKKLRQLPIAQCLMYL